jgi:DNA-binding GntR family transcriptional regulator
MFKAIFSYFFAAKPKKPPTTREIGRAQTKLECMYIRKIRESNNDEQLDKILTIYHKARGALARRDLDCILRTTEELKQL